MTKSDKNLMFLDEPTPPEELVIPIGELCETDVPCAYIKIEDGRAYCEFLKKEIKGKECGINTLDENDF